METLLVLDNDIDTLDMITYVFERSFEVVRSPFLLTIHKVIEVMPNIIILDHIFNDGYGSELCSIVKSTPRTKHIPVILMSASYNLYNVAKKCYADKFIEKPFDIYYLEKEVYNLINSELYCVPAKIEHVKPTFNPFI